LMHESSESDTTMLINVGFAELHKIQSVSFQIIKRLLQS